MKKKAMFSMIIVIVGFVSSAGADIIWPADGDWIALRLGTNYYYDAVGDQSPAAVDLIGTKDSFSAGYWAYAMNGYDNGLSLEDAFMVRMRVGGQSGNFVWQANLDTDGNTSNLEWIFQLVQSGSSDRVILVKTAVGGPTLNDVDIGSNTATWSGAVGQFSRWSPISGSSDYHVDIAVPWNTFTAITGVSEPNQIRVVLSTTTTHAGINKDAPLGVSLTEQISNVLSDNIPEPTVASLLLGTGFGIVAYRRIFNRKPENEEDSPA